jgi:hypothetical protein
MAARTPESKRERFAGVIMSVLAAVVFGVLGVLSIKDHEITLPGRSGGPVHNSGAAADLVGWLLLAAAAAFLSHIAMLLKPGKTGGMWALGIFGVWAAAATVYLSR